MAKAFEDKFLEKCEFWGSSGGGATINAAAARTNCGKTLMNMDASLYVGAAQTNLLAAQAHYGKTLMEKDPLKYDGAARNNLLAAQGDYGKSLMQKDPLKYEGVSKTNLIAAQNDYGKSLMQKDPSKYEGVSKTSLMAAQADYGKTLMEKDPSKYEGAARTNIMLAQANFGKIGLDREVNKNKSNDVSFRAELSAFITENKAILVGFIGKAGESTFLTLPDAFNFIWAHEYKKDNVSRSSFILVQLRLAVTWTDKRDVGREPFTLCLGFNIYTRRSPPEGTEPRPRSFPSDVVCYKCVNKEYGSRQALYKHFYGNELYGRKPHLDCEKVWNEYSN